MGADAALLESAVAGGTATLRWYRWESATLSLGYFQAQPNVAVPDERFGRLPVVRRLTGGGAIIHDRELTYSVTLPAGHHLAGDPRRLYTGVHERIISVLADLGFTATLRGSLIADRRDAFLCFGRGDDFDVVMGPSKVLGSAQRRRKGAVLQHGSLLLRRSAWAEEFPGVFDCGGHAVSEDVLTARLAEVIAALLGGRSERHVLSPAEQARALVHEELARRWKGADISHPNDLFSV